MSQVSEIDIPEYVDSFFRKWGPGRCRIVALTFQFDPSVFEARLDRILSRGGIRTDVVTGEPPTQPKRGSYYVWRANWPGTFHPKVLLLLANAQVAVGLGSANMTAGGFGGNLECWQFFERCSANRLVLGNVHTFLGSLSNRKIIPRHLEIEELMHALPPAESGTLLNTLHAANVLSQVASTVRRPVQRLDVISPVNCDPGELVLQMRKAFGLREVHLFTNLAGKGVPGIRGCDHYYVLKAPEKSKEEDETTRRYATTHAKMYAFYSRKWVDLFWGSGNLSASAWLRTGRKANVDFLVHSRLGKKEWTNLRDGLPAGHRWGKKQPVEDGVLPKDPPPVTDRFRLLNAVWTGRKLSLESNRSEELKLWLRTCKSPTVQVLLKFKSNCASVSSEAASRLGFSTGPAPETLQYGFQRQDLQEIIVNDLSYVVAGLGSSDVAALLFWRYTGRLLPGSGTATTVRPRNDENEGEAGMEIEEEELARCLHQGALDRFVLQWRLNAHRIEACSGKNRGLMRQRFIEARRLIAAEADERPGEWPVHLRKFVDRLFDETLKKAKWRVSKK
jgi:hypothetical protein